MKEFVVQYPQLIQCSSVSNHTPCFVGMITSEQIQKRDTSSSLLPNELEIEEAFLGM